MTPCTLLRETAACFRQAGIPDAETDSALLLSSLCGRPPLELRLDTDSELDEKLLSAFHALTKRRLSREPLQYITGEAPFFGLVFRVDPRVLIPRPETELLCEWALECLEEVPSPRILDLCCGSGCIGLSLSARRPDAAVTLSDLSADALAVAAENADRLALKVHLRQGDLAEGLPDASFDMVVSNPPYIPSSQCPHLQPEVLREPRLALDGGTDGCDLYRRIVPDVRRILRPGGYLLMELGWEESDIVAGLLKGHGFSSVTVRDDFNGIHRMIYAVCTPPEELCSRN